MKKVLAVLLVLVVAVAAFLFFPRAGGLEAANAAVLGILSAGVDAQRSGAPAFEPALDGDLFTTGDVVRADPKGLAVLTFFDGSTLSVDPSARVKVTSLTKTGDGGIQLTLEQTAGRTWASVSKLTPQSRFELKTPSTTAVVRGTTFETIVETLPDGRVVTTIKTAEGEVVAQATAGGEVSIPVGTQAAIGEGQQAPPAPQPQPPTPKLRFTGPAGTGFVVTDPRGLQCGSAAGVVTRLAPRCDVGAGAAPSVVIGDVVAGLYTVTITAAAAVPNATFVAEGLGVQATDFTYRVTRSLSLGDLVRTTLTVTVGTDGKLGSAGFTPPAVITTVCGAESTGRVFSSGVVSERVELVSRYAAEAKGQPAAYVLESKELTEVALQNIKEQNLPVALSDVAVTIDIAGVHIRVNAAIGPLGLPARADLIAGEQGGRLVMKLSRLEAGPLPGPLLDRIIAAVQKSVTQFADQFPLVVQRVTFRAGCMAVIGRTPS